PVLLSCLSNCRKLRRKIAAPLHLANQKIRLWVFLIKLCGRHRERRQIFYLRVGHHVYDCFWMKLLLYVPVQPHCANALNITGASAEAKAIQNMKNALLLCETRGLSRRDALLRRQSQRKCARKKSKDRKSCHSLAGND